jgi:hypothetical protein
LKNRQVVPAPMNEVISFLIGTFTFFEWPLLACAFILYGTGSKKIGLILGILCAISISSDLFSPKTEAQIEAIQDAHEDRLGDMTQE